MEPNQYAQIELYLSGELSAAEQEAFTRALQTDPELAAALQEYREADATFKEIVSADETELTLAAQMQQLGKKYFPQQSTPVTPVKSMRKWWTGAAVAAAVILVFFLGRLLLPDRPSPQELYSQYYQPYELDASVIRNTKPGTDSLLRRADSLYRIKQFTSAIPLYQQYLAATPNLSEAGLPLAAAFLQSGRTDSADFYFTRIALAVPASRGEAIWYRAMIQLQQNNTTACRNLLQQIGPQDDSKYYKKATSLLQQL